MVNHAVTGTAQPGHRANAAQGDAARANVPPARSTDAADPVVYARMILRRAGIAPLVPALVCAVALGTATPGSAQSATPVRATALASARATIINQTVRSGPVAGTGQAGRTVTTIVGQTERATACPAPVVAGAPAAAAPCIRYRLIIRDMP